jgi:HEXXH motif-containing protein
LVVPVGDQTEFQDFPHHKVSWTDFDEIARGYAEPRAVRRLRRAEYSRRKLLLRALDDKLTKTPTLMGPLPPPEVAWELLDRVERAAPKVLDRIITHPYTGSWAGYVTRLLNDQIAGVCPLWVHVGHLHAIAAAAAIRAGIAFDTDIPVWDGGAILPTLGMARLTSDTTCSIAHVRSNGHEVEISNKTTLAHVPHDPAEETPNWWGLRRLSARTDHLGLSVALDDIDPYRGLYEPVAPQRLDAADVRRWAVLLDEAWQLIVRCLPNLAQAFPRGLESLVPRPAIPFRNLSASTGEAFGSAIVARPADSYVMAEALVHEFHHILLGGLLHLVPLHRNDQRERFYTLWRDDPRHTSGVLQGVFAFFGVTALWRSLARSEKDPWARRAQFEFAYYRSGTWQTLRSLSGDASLTEHGQRFVDGIAEQLGPWQDEPVPADIASLAASATSDHRAGWRIRHLRPRPDTVANFASLWLAGQSRPTSAEPDQQINPTPVPDGSWTRARTDLIRESLTTPGLNHLRQTWPLVPGATAADFTYVSGRHGDAIDGYLTELAHDSEDPTNWVGLGLALSANGGDTAGARALLNCPELVRAVYRWIRATTTMRPDPRELAVWIGRSVC